MARTASRTAGAQAKAVPNHRNHNHRGHNHQDCIDEALDSAARLCGARGTRFTPLRRRVLELVWSGHEPVKAYDLLARLGGEEGSAKPPTVYRALDFLIEQGLVHRLESLNAYVGCPHAERDHDFQFLICDDCATVTEIVAPALRTALARHAAEAGFTIKRQTVEIHGTCRDCADRAPARAKP